MGMSSRERVLAVINHREPDRVPIDLGGTRNSSIEVGLYTRLRDHLGIEGDPAKVLDVHYMTAWLEHPVIEALGIDVLTVPRLTWSFGLRADRWRPWKLPDSTPVQMPANFDPVIEPDGGLSLYKEGKLVGRKAASNPSFDRMSDFEIHESLPPVESFHLPVFSDEELTWRRHWAETLRAETEKALIGDFGAVLGRWGSYQEWLYTIAADPEYVLAFYKRKIENLLTDMQLYAQAVGDKIDILWLGEDYGTQQGLMISRTMFNQMVAPHYKRLFDWVHQHTQWKILFHCCGAIYPIIGTLIECGVDILNPVQLTARGLDPNKLKEEFGDRLVFWGGGIDTQTILPFGSPEEIREQVKQRIQTFGPGGGFVFAASHNIQSDVPLENLLAMVEAIREYGQYPL
jgi:uroporphyrinogen decarboxylase